MNVDIITSHVFEIYKKCNIKNFPINCISVLSEYGYKTKPYSELSPIKKTACLKLSKDACTIKDTIYYNDSSHHKARIRFSLMHEFGHIILQTEDEDEADYFASYILAPRAVMYLLNCNNADDVHATFEISYTASNRAWYDHLHGARADAERQIKEWFFPSKTKPMESESIDFLVSESAIETKNPEPDAEYVPSKEFEERRAKALARIKRRRRKTAKQLKKYYEDMDFLGEFAPDILFAHAEHQWLYGNDL